MKRWIVALVALAGCDDGASSADDMAVDAAPMVVVDAEPDAAPPDAALARACGAQITYTYDEPVSYRRLPRQDATRGEFAASCGEERGPERIVELVLAEPSRVEVYFESEVPLTLFVRRACLDAGSETFCEVGLVEGPTFESLDAGRWYLFFEPAEEGAAMPAIYVRTVSTAL